MTLTNTQKDNYSNTFAADIIFVKKFTQPQFLAPKIYAKKSVNRDKIEFATKWRKCYKMTSKRENKWTIDTLSSFIWQLPILYNCTWDLAEEREVWIFFLEPCCHHRITLICSCDTSTQYV